MKSCAFFVLTVALSACTNQAEKSPAAADADKVFYDYKVWAEEGREDATVMLRYLAGGEQGEALALPKRAAVTLDGEPLQPDSAAAMGIFYEAIKAVDRFSGPHKILLTDAAGKKHEETFVFTPFTLAEDLPDEVPKQPFTLKLKGLPAGESAVRLVMVDTSYTSKDVNEEITVVNGELRIGTKALANLTKGPITMEIYREEEKPLRQSPGSGRLLITYSLRRQFLFTE